MTAWKLQNRCIYVGSFIYVKDIITLRILSRVHVCVIICDEMTDTMESSL